ncbi:MAG: hypothetical protein FD161_614 [Limisphaerales bacterium]|nr:MAG: hypothetical protein FD161_614 [Limisphaerales bacterium]KAG0510219.1 MAG: hypothetical protein E1N63_614 [Limisphaerales bacterium]TXT51898.1 MAG: hypothetical protein FD140_1286 [Limisphaerales bacterium]
MSGNASAAMNEVAQINLVLAWLWLLLGFVSGTVMGLFFHREDWLGGYASHARRMYRLGHISFFGLGLVNWMFHGTAQRFPAMTPAAQFASWAFVVGAVTMPLCCALMAQNVRWRHAFAVPVVSLLVGAALTVKEVIRL